MNGPDVSFVNVQYFFRLIYDALHQRGGASVSLTHFFDILSGWWLGLSILAYLVSLGAFAALVYYSIRLRQTIVLEAPKYATLAPAAAESAVEHSRWAHVTALVESSQESDWRQAIIEADIMLDEILAYHGYQGATVAEKLKQGDSRRFTTLQDAWDAHKVRNEIAHQGSNYPLTDHSAYRTIQKYGNVFREFGEI